MNLGLLNRVCQPLLWFQLAPERPGAPVCNAHDIQVNTFTMRHAYYQWHKRRHVANRSERLTRIGDFGAKVFGTSRESALKTKGAETWSLVLFLIDFVGSRAGALDRRIRDLLTGARALVRLLQLWKQCGVTLSRDEVAASFDCWNEFLSATRAWDELKIPKKHMIAHMLERLEEAGNPTCYSNWLNESLNKLLKQCARQVSQHTFESGLLVRMRALLRKRSELTAPKPRT